jgi:hypothetical protein
MQPKKTMIPKDLLDLTGELLAKYKNCPIDRKPWGPVEALRYMLASIAVDANSRTPEQRFAFNLIVGYIKSEECSRVRAPRGPKPMHLLEAGDEEALFNKILGE